MHECEVGQHQGVPVRALSAGVVGEFVGLAVTRVAPREGTRDAVSAELPPGLEGELEIGGGVPDVVVVGEDCLGLVGRVGEEANVEAVERGGAEADEHAVRGGVGWRGKSGVVVGDYDDFVEGGDRGCEERGEGYVEDVGALVGEDGNAGGAAVSGCSFSDACTALGGENGRETNVNLSSIRWE